MRTISMNIPEFPSFTALPNSFIDNYMVSANHTYVVLYIYFYRHCMSGQVSLTMGDAAAAFNILESDVIKCFEFWQSVGLIRLTESGEDLGIEFLNIPQGPVQKEQPAPPEPSPAPAVEDAVPLKEPVRLRPVAIDNRPSYSVEELEIYRADSDEIRQLFHIAEQSFGRLLTYSELDGIYGLYDWLRLPLPVIKILLEYCSANNHRNIRYIEKAAMDWAENGITDPDAATEYIRRFNTDYREVMKAFGHSNRTPSKSEEKYLDKWLVEWAIPLDVVLEACDRTIMQTGSAKFSYCDKIVSGWQKSGVKTVEDAQRLTDEFRERAADTRAAEKKPKKKAEQKPSRFVNFTQREWNFDEIERRERQFLEDSLRRKPEPEEIRAVL